MHQEKSIFKIFGCSLLYALYLIVLLELIMRLGGLLLLMPHRLRFRADSNDSKSYRILCIGESTTYGVGVKPYQTYSRILEQLLNQHVSQERFHVINAGVPGQTSTSVVRNIDYLLLKHKPQLVLSLLGANDINESINDLSLNFKGIPSIFRDSRVYKLVSLLKDWIEFSPQISQDGAMVYFDPKQESPGGGHVINYEYLSVLTRNYSHIIRKVRSHGGRTVLLSYLHRRPQVHHCLKDIARENDVLYLDLVVSPFVIRGLLAKDGWHPNEEGHRAMGLGIYRGLIENGIIHWLGHLG